ncbi:MAG: YggS family pyridoxal phosphate-dependent enzyme [Bacteroidota bacterium]
MVNLEAWKDVMARAQEKNALLVAVSKTKLSADIELLYNAGQRDFGESYVQELADKYPQLPVDIRWHFIGHLQGNKVKYIAPFVHLIHAVDSFKLLEEINKQALKNDRVIDVLLQMHIADEDTKYGMDEKEIMVFLEYYTAQLAKLQNVRICGLMGMATYTEDEEQVRSEFFRLRNFFIHLRDTSFFNKPWFSICSMGMSSDYDIALHEGSTMVRVGSILFGSR